MLESSKVSPASACAAATDAAETGGIAMDTTHTKELTEQDLAVGGGVEPEELPEAARMTSTFVLRELGLPFRCEGGSIMQDQSLALAEELHDSERESRVVYFEYLRNGVKEFASVQYTRPVDISITTTFEPWPEDETVLVSLYDEDQFGKLRMREVGEEPPIH
jgi:hypothetical protein